MKIIYKNELNEKIHNILNIPTICDKCGCTFQIENEKEIQCYNGLGFQFEIGKRTIYSELYYVHCPNCARMIDLYKKEWEWINSEKKYL